jgi:hypothetical protein
MICQECHGFGTVLKQQVISQLSEDRSVVAWVKMPCDTCGGSGVSYCCEGHEAQPDHVNT